MNRNQFISSIEEKLDLKFRRRVPVVHQTETSECGLACLAMICGHYGRNIDLIALRRQINLSARGASLASVQQTGIELGMESRALSLDLHELNALRMPCILHLIISRCSLAYVRIASCFMILPGGEEQSGPKKCHSASPEWRCRSGPAVHLCRKR